MKHGKAYNIAYYGWLGFIWDTVSSIFYSPRVGNCNLAFPIQGEWK